MHVAHSSVLFVQTLLNKTICQKKSGAMGTALILLNHFLYLHLFQESFTKMGTMKKKELRERGPTRPKKVMAETKVMAEISEARKEKRRFKLRRKEMKEFYIRHGDFIAPKDERRVLI